MEFLPEHQGHRETGGLRWDTESICVTLTQLGVHVAPSTYYAHRNRLPSHRQRRDAELEVRIRRVHQAAHDGTYAARKVWLQLHREDIPVARCIVERLMRRLDLAGATRGR